MAIPIVKCNPNHLLHTAIFREYNSEFDAAAAAALGEPVRPKVENGFIVYKKGDQKIEIQVQTLPGSACDLEHKKKLGIRYSDYKKKVYSKFLKSIWTKLKPEHRNNLRVLGPTTADFAAVQIDISQQAISIQATYERIVRARPELKHTALQSYLDSLIRGKLTSYLDKVSTKYFIDLKNGSLRLESANYDSFHLFPERDLRDFAGAIKIAAEELTVEFQEEHFLEKLVSLLVKKEQNDTPEFTQNSEGESVVDGDIEDREFAEKLSKTEWEKRAETLANRMSTKESDMRSKILSRIAEKRAKRTAPPTQSERRAHAKLEKKRKLINESDEEAEARKSRKAETKVTPTNPVHRPRPIPVAARRAEPSRERAIRIKAEKIRQVILNELGNEITSAMVDQVVKALVLKNLTTRQARPYGNILRRNPAFHSRLTAQSIRTMQARLGARRFTNSLSRGSISKFHSHLG